MTRNILKTIKKNIKSVPNFPKKGIIFRDITPLLENKKIFKKIVDTIVKIADKKKINKIVAIESRGFIFSAPVAYKKQIPMILVRKPSKLPRSIYKVKYALEYGYDTLEIHKDSIKKKDRVMVIDDLIATGGTAGAAAKLISKSNKNKIEFLFLIELEDLKGVSKLVKMGHGVNSLCKFTEDEM